MTALQSDSSEPFTFKIQSGGAEGAVVGLRSLSQEDKARIGQLIKVLAQERRDKQAFQQQLQQQASKLKDMELEREQGRKQESELRNRVCRSLQLLRDYQQELYSHRDVESKPNEGLVSRHLQCSSEQGLRADSKSTEVPREAIRRGRSPTRPKLRALGVLKPQQLCLLQRYLTIQQVGGSNVARSVADAAASTASENLANLLGGSSAKHEDLLVVAPMQPTASHRSTNLGAKIQLAKIATGHPIDDHPQHQNISEQLNAPTSKHNARKNADHLKAATFCNLVPTSKSQGDLPLRMSLQNENFEKAARSKLAQTPRSLSQHVNWRHSEHPAAPGLISTTTPVQELNVPSPRAVPRPALCKSAHPSSQGPKESWNDDSKVYASCPQNSQGLQLLHTEQCNPQSSVPRPKQSAACQQPIPHVLQCATCTKSLTHPANRRHAPTLEPSSLTLLPHPDEHHPPAPLALRAHQEMAEPSTSPLKLTQNTKKEVTVENPDSFIPHPTQPPTSMQHQRSLKQISSSDQREQPIARINGPFDTLSCLPTDGAGSNSQECAKSNHLKYPEHQRDLTQSPVLVQSSATLSQTALPARYSGVDAKTASCEAHVQTELWPLPEPLPARKPRSCSPSVASDVRASVTFADDPSCFRSSHSCKTRTLVYTPGSPACNLHVSKLPSDNNPNVNSGVTTASPIQRLQRISYSPHRPRSSYTSFGSSWPGTLLEGYYPGNMFAVIDSLESPYSAATGKKTLCRDELQDLQHLHEELVKVEDRVYGRNVSVNFSTSGPAVLDVASSAPSRNSCEFDVLLQRPRALNGTGDCKELTAEIDDVLFLLQLAPPQEK